MKFHIRKAFHMKHEISCTAIVLHTPVQAAGTILKGSSKIPSSGIETHSGTNHWSRKLKRQLIWLPIFEILIKTLKRNSTIVSGVFISEIHNESTIALEAQGGAGGS